MRFRYWRIRTESLLDRRLRSRKSHSWREVAVERKNRKGVRQTCMCERIGQIFLNRQLEATCRFV